MNSTVSAVDQFADRPALRKRLRALSAIPPRERTEEGDTVEETRAFRGLTVEAAIRYLENLGGERLEDRHVAGDGWEATLSVGTAPVGPSYRLTEVTITWRGDEGALAPVIAGFRLKAFRAPG